MRPRSENFDTYSSANRCAPNAMVCHLGCLLRGQPSEYLAKRAGLLFSVASALFCICSISGSAVAQTSPRGSGADAWNNSGSQRFTSRGDSAQNTQVHQPQVHPSLKTVPQADRSPGTASQSQLQQPSQIVRGQNDSSESAKWNAAGRSYTPNSTSSATVTTGQAVTKGPAVTTASALVPAQAKQRLTSADASSIVPGSNSELQEASVDSTQAGTPLNVSSEAKSPAKKKSSGVFGALVSIGSSFVIVMALFLGVAWFYKKTVAASLGSSLPKQVVDVLGRSTIATRQQLVLVRFGSKLVLVSLVQGDARAISEITDPVEVDRLTGECESLKPGSSVQSFRSVLAQGGRA